MTQRYMVGFGRGIIFLSICLLSACSTNTEQNSQTSAAEDVVQSNMEAEPVAEIKLAFSGYDEIDGLPSDWEQMILTPQKKRTEYMLKKFQGKTVLHARANAAASGLRKKVNARVQKLPWLSWSWKVIKHIPEADNTQRHTEDSPVRIVLAFEGDKSKLSFREQMIMQQAKVLFNQEMPYATLMYIWENRQPVGTVIDNKITGRIKMIVAESGGQRVGEWVNLKRNVLEDYRKAYGEEPGRLVGMAVLTDSDNTKGFGESYYGDLFLTNH